ncbi:MAG: TonB-dependent receptor [Paludibacter sp.]|nr:TonB-dependent receptor [Paludibacter sp.]
MKVIKTSIFFLVIVFSINIITAQNNISDSIRLSEVVVTGSKTEISRKLVPLSVSQISRSDIENSGQINVLTTLSGFVPGFFVTERSLLGFGVGTGGSGAITMRGISSQPNSSVLVLIDGHPQYQGIFGHPLPDAYVASDVEKVEVIRGPASILYGSNAMSGVINMITKKQKEDGVKLNLGASYGSYNTQKYHGTIGYKKHKWNIFASANHDRTDGFRENTDFKISNGYLKTGYEINKNLSLQADASIAKYDANDNGPLHAPAAFGIDIMRGKAALSLDNKFEKANGSLKIYHNFGEHILSDGFQSTDRNSGIMLYETFKLWNGNSLTAGTDLKQYGGKANRGAAANQLKTVNEIALYAYTSQQLLQKLNINAGLRLENNSVYGSELIPMLGLSYMQSAQTSFKASASKGFRSPTVMEMYIYAPNDSLKPERMMNYEISWLQSLLSNKLQFELTAFLVEGENLIQIVPPVVTMRQNAGTFSNKGIELSAKYEITKNLRIQGNYSFTDIEKPVLAAPRHQANLSANYSYKIWNLNLSGQYADGLYTRINPTSATESYLLLNARLAAQVLPQLNIFVMANNLLNQKYEINYGYPMPGTYVNAGVNVRI